MAAIPYFLTKGIGLASIGYTLKDAHHYGKIKSDQYSTKKDAEYAIKYLNNTQYLNYPSYIQNQIKELSFEHEIDSRYFHNINKPIGYFKGFTYVLIEKAFPLCMGLGALLLKMPFSSNGNNKLTGILAGLCACISALNIAKECFHSYFAVGTPNSLKRNTY